MSSLGCANPLPKSFTLVVEVSIGPHYGRILNKSRGVLNAICSGEF